MPKLVVGLFRKSDALALVPSLLQASTLGETNSFDSVEKIKQAFGTNQLFQGVSVSDTRVGAAANQVVFRLTYTVQRP